MSNDEIITTKFGNFYVRKLYGFFSFGSAKAVIEEVLPVGWRLPNTEELKEIYRRRDDAGGGFYWTSDEHKDGDAIALNFVDGKVKVLEKDNMLRTYAVKDVADKQNSTEIDDTQKKIKDVIHAVETFLLEKNKRYGNSALAPLSIFSSFVQNDELNTSILVRLDDKLSRIKNSDTIRKNDVADLIGYLILLCVDMKWDNFSEFID